MVPSSLLIAVDVTNTTTASDEDQPDRAELALEYAHAFLDRLGDLRIFGVPASAAITLLAR